jgi:hypothetical protein
MVPLGADVVVVASAAGAGCGIFCPLCPPVDLWAVGLGHGPGAGAGAGAGARVPVVVAVV